MRKYVCMSTRVMQESEHDMNMSTVGYGFDMEEL